MVFSSGESLGKSLAEVPGGIAWSVADATTEPGPVQEYADAFQETFNLNADVLLRYANDRISSALSTKLRIEALQVAAYA